MAATVSFRSMNRIGVTDKFTRLLQAPMGKQKIYFMRLTYFKLQWETEDLAAKVATHIRQVGK